jgi:hypothetical protein
VIIISAMQFTLCTLTIRLATSLPLNADCPR